MDTAKINSGLIHRFPSEADASTEADEVFAALRSAAEPEHNLLELLGRIVPDLRNDSLVLGTDLRLNQSNVQSWHHVKEGHLSHCKVMIGLTNLICIDSKGDPTGVVTPIQTSESPHCGKVRIRTTWASAS